MPGSSLPSRYSSDAPPPVEMWENPSSGRPSARTAAAESPPPTTLNAPFAVTSTIACATPRVPSANGASSNTPIGPFQNTVFAPASTSRERRDRLRADVQALPAVRDLLDRHRAGVRLGRELVGDHDVHRQHDLARLQQPAAVDDLVGLQQRVTDPVALRGQEGEAHPAADQQRVDLRQQRLDDQQLVRHLRPAEHHHVRPLRVVGQPAQHLDLGRAPARRRRRAARCATS